MRRVSTTVLGMAVVGFAMASAGGENTEPPRAARSVHLGYPAPDAAMFYQEVTVERSVPGSFRKHLGA